MISWKREASTTKGRRLGRRTFLQGVLGTGASVAVGLPALEVMLNSNGTAHADGTDLPKRLGIFFWGNGVHPQRWVPRTTGADWQLSEQLAPLAEVKHRVTVVSGMNNHCAGVDGHGDGAAVMLTGHGATMVSPSPKNLSPRAESIDQIAARRIGAGTSFRSLELRISRRVHTREGTLYAYTSFNDANSPNEPEREPLQVYNRVFGSFDPGGSVDPLVEQVTTFRRSALDAVMADIAALKAEVGAADRMRLDQHFENVRSIENRLAGGGAGMGSACRRPEAPEMLPEEQFRQEDLATRMQLMSDLVAMALACDRTRVFTLQYTGSVALTLFPIEGFTQDQHQLTHDEPGDQPLVHQSILHTMAAFGQLVSSLDAVTEGAGSVLDRSVIMGATDCAEGRGHYQHDMPILLAGSAGGKLREGIHYRSNGENTNLVLFSILNAVGCELREFGEQSQRHDARVTSGCSQIEV